MKKVPHSNVLTKAEKLDPKKTAETLATTEFECPNNNP